MKAFLRCATLVAPLAMVVVLGLTTASAQFLVNGFETAAADSQFKWIKTNPQAYRAYHHMTDDAAVKTQGAASMKSEWQLMTTESYGGFNQLMFLLPRSANDTSYYSRKYRWLYKDSTNYLDWSAGTHLSLWFNNQVKSNVAAGAVQMRFKIHEAGGAAKYYDLSASTFGDDHEDWYFQTAAIYDTTPGWKELIIPLKDNGAGGPNDQGFTLPGWSGQQNNGVLDFDKIIGYSIEWTSGLLTGDSTAAGITNYDNLLLNGLGKKTGYEPFYTFNNFTQDTTNFSTGWTNSPLGGISFYEEKVDTLVGPSALGFDYKINVKEDWGGGANREYKTPSGTFFPDLSAKTELLMFVKVIEPLTSSTGTMGNKISFRFILEEFGSPSEEDWFTVANVRLDSAGLKMGWQMVSLPLEGTAGGWADLKVGSFTTPQGPQDGIMQLNKIGGLRMELSSSREAGEPFAPDLIYSGKILISMIVPAGFRETDKTPPAAVTGVSTTASTYTNLVTWTDVPGEPTAKYNAYVSEQNFSATTDAGVEDVPPYNIALGTQLQTHRLLAPINDANVTLYYGVTAQDKAGNTNAPTVVGPVTNLAKGVPTISKTAPASFVANGNLSEWSSIAPITMSVAGAVPTAFVAPNGLIGGDADAKAMAYLAVDNTALYVAFDVDDDLVSIDTLVTDYQQDCADLFIGLYDWRGAKHGSYTRGTKPDYHLRFSLNRIWMDNGPSDPVKVIDRPGANYIFKLKTLTPGYTIEAKIPWTSFRIPFPEDSLFVPVEGMRIPIDFAINDRDAQANRDGIMCYSPLNEDLSYGAMWRWTYTWIGALAKPVTGVNDVPGVAYEYRLQQNYPNPFNPSTVIRYSLAKTGPVTVRVYDVIGREVATLVNGDVQTAGPHEVLFSSGNLRAGLSTGVYFYQIESGAFRDVKKMVLLK